MKVAITAKGTDLKSDVEPRFGRCQWFLLVDTETKEFEVIDNAENVNRAGGAGIGATKLIVSKGAEALITGHCGPNAFTTLSEAGIKVFFGSQGSVEEMLDKLEKGELPEVEAPDVRGHW